MMTKPERLWWFFYQLINITIEITCFSTNWKNYFDQSILLISITPLQNGREYFHFSISKNFERSIPFISITPLHKGRKYFHFSISKIYFERLIPLISITPLQNGREYFCIFLLLHNIFSNYLEKLFWLIDSSHIINTQGCSHVGYKFVGCGVPIL